MSVDEEAMLPGERLRRAREEQGLSQDEVSKHLRLSLSYLRALEEDDYDRLPEPPFIKGYLRNYARFLGLPAEELARRFQQEVDALSSAEDERHQEAQEDTPRGREWRLPILLILVVALVVALGWWLWPRDGAVPGASAPAGEAGAPASESAPAEGGTPEPALPENTDPVAPADETLEPLPDNGGASPDGGGPAPSRLPGSMSDESELADAGAPDAGVADTTDAAPRPAEDGVDRLRLSFSRVCWIKVVDASGATLSQGQRQAGDSVTLEGEAPFRLTVGDAAAVSSVSVNGESLALPSQRSGDVVRVTLP
ncbi:RodZ domain-containing protein [Alloalcanivorax sp. C16-2]|uniref:helix-turn-helix domain-containing protein n=1 Tax=Alloalcanivorax TaxID=3020832 RepID=UPI001932D080|nr:RodZ family helix-turn-helix domain-containing protein [Alloalcanivorax marinus]MBL7251504.1 helix-turn-helix domain-containing protein [Alloalcanivorax marinus]